MQKICKARGIYAQREFPKHVYKIPSHTHSRAHTHKWNFSLATPVRNASVRACITNYVTSTLISRSKYSSASRAVASGHTTMRFPLTKRNWRRELNLSQYPLQMTMISLCSCCRSWAPPRNCRVQKLMKTPTCPQKLV